MMDSPSAQGSSGTSKKPKLIAFKPQNNRCNGYYDGFLGGRDLGFRLGLAGFRL